MENPAHNDDHFGHAIHEAIRHSGREAVYRNLLRLAGIQNNPDDTLTIVSNLGVHPLPNEYLRGTVFIASEGSLDFSSMEMIHREFTVILKKTARMLKSREWHTVYIVPFGPAPLSMQIKLLVYRVCGIETIEVMHHPYLPRVDISINLRDLIVQADQPDANINSPSLSEMLRTYGMTPGITGLPPSLSDKK